MRAPLHARTILAPVVLCAVVAACGDDPAAPEAGELELTVVSTGADIDASGYTVLVDDEARGGVAANDVVTIRDLSSGQHRVALADATANCDVAGANPRTFEVAAAATTAVVMAVQCVPFVGALRVVVSSAGDDLDVDGYSVAANGSETAVPANGSAVIAGLQAGTAVVALLGVAENCDVQAPNPRTIDVAFSTTVEVRFDVTCHGTATVRVATVSTGTDRPADYDALLRSHAAGAVRGATVPSTGEAVFEAVGAGEYEVLLDRVPPNCGIHGAATRRVVVERGATVDVTLDVVCVDAPLLMFGTWDGGGVIAVIKSNGVGYTPVAPGDPSEHSPDWAPGGARVAFTSERDGDSEIYTMDADGTDVARLTHDPATDFAPAWSPDGARIAFVRNGDIWVMSADGSGEVRLPVGDGATNGDPGWSPDGSRIVFASDRSGNSDIFVMDDDGSDVRVLTSDPDGDWDPAWSPDGSKIAFARCHDPWCYDSEILVMNADGGGELVSLFRGEGAFDPAWSADGRWVAFATYCYYYCAASPGLTAVSVDGSRSFLIAQGNAASPSWRR